MPFIEHVANNNGQAPEFRPYDVVGKIMEYEDGVLDEDETLELFQHLVDTGMAWQLQGHYGRTAIALIRAGYIKRGTR